MNLPYVSDDNSQINVNITNERCSNVIVNSFHDVNKSSVIFLLSYIKPVYLKAKFNKTKSQLL